MEVLVTRPKGRSSRTAEELRRRGAEVLELPSIRTVPLEDQSTLVHAFEEISSYQWIVFTSPTGVEIFFDELKKHIKIFAAWQEHRLLQSVRARQKFWKTGAFLLI
mgnify:CR=1 FL=1